MTLQFVVPPLSGQDADNAGLAETERWLANLPVLNAAESSYQLFNALTSLNRQPLDDMTRLQILELYRRPVHVICAEQHKRYLGLPVPLPQDSRLVAERVRQFQVEMAYGYKRIVLGFSENHGRDAETKSGLALAVQRTIRYLTETLAKSYELYTPGPEGTWRELHQLYLYTEAEGITELPVTDELNASVTHSSIGHAYKQALLLDFSDPYHLPAQMLQKICQYLDAYAPLAQIVPVTDTLKQECQFLVNLGNDRAGVTNTENPPITMESQYRLLTTVWLTRALHQQLSALQNGEPPPADALGKDFYTNRGKEMLMRLITSWGVNPRRYFPRTPKEGVKIEVIRGVDNINRCVNGGAPFMLSTTEVGPQPARDEIGRQAEDPSTTVDQRVDSGELWDLLDESAGGFSLARASTSNQHVHVGDLIATRIIDQKMTRGIAVVRWARSSGPDHIEIGVERLAPSAKPVAVAAGNAPGSSFAMALRLPEIKSLRMPETLITPYGSFKPQRILILDDGYRTYQIRAIKLVNLTHSFEQFQFAFLE